MTGVFVWWAISAIVLALSAVFLGGVIGRGYIGILIDNRGRYSLTQLQLVVWIIIILSLISGVFFSRLLGGLSKDALMFSIPDELLIVIGVSVSSTVAATVVKAQKNASIPDRIAASGANDRPRFSQIFLLEEGILADQVIDISKFQNFWITAILAVSYVALAIAAIKTAGTVDHVNALPGFSGNFVTLLAISHAGYIAGKLPNGTGIPKGLTYESLKQGGHAVNLAAGVQARMPPPPPHH